MLHPDTRLMTEVIRIPEALNADDPAHVQTIYQAIENSTQSPLESVRKPAEDLLKACEDLPGYTSVLAMIAGTHAADPDARAGAVILLKNVVRVRWKSRGGRGRLVGEGEKAALRGFLLRAMEEPNAKVAVLLAVLMAKVARVDWPRQWSELFGSLMASATQGQALRRKRAVYSLHQVLKELSSKRVGFDKAAFSAMAAELFPVIKSMWDAQWVLVERVLAAVSPVSAEEPANSLGPEAVEALGLATTCVKVLYRLIIFGIPGLEHVQAAPFFEALLQRMHSLESALSRIRLPWEAGTRRGVGGGQEDELWALVAGLQKLWRRMGIVAVDAQKDFPIAFRRYLGPYLAFFYEQLEKAVQGRRDACVPLGVIGGSQLGRDPNPASTGERLPTASPYGPFTIQCLSFLSNTVSCTSYHQELLVKACSKGGGGGGVGGRAGEVPRKEGRMITARGAATVTPEIAQYIVSTMTSFFTADRMLSMLDLLLEGVLPMEKEEMEEWVSDPEQFYLLQDSLVGQESVRVSGEQLYMSLLEGVGVGMGDVVAARVVQLLSTSEGVQKQAEACRRHTSPSPQFVREMLSVDALYLCAGLGAYKLKSHLDFQQWFARCLGPSLEVLVATMQSSQDATCGADVAVRLSAAGALHALLSLWDLDPATALAPGLPWLFPALYRLFADVEAFESRQQVLTVMADLVERSGRLLVPHSNAAVSSLPDVWQASEDQTPLRSTCLVMMTNMIKAMGADKGPELEAMALNMISVATDTGKDEGVYLMEPGLELWLAVMRHCATYSPSLHQLFARIPSMLERDLDNLKEVMLILEAYTVVGGDTFLQTHANGVCQCFRRVIGQVKPKGAAFVCRALESLLRKFPADGSRMLQSAGVLELVLGSCLAALRNDDDREPDLVIVMHLSVLCRVFLGEPDAFRRLFLQAAREAGVDGEQGADQIVGEVVGQMSLLFDSAGYNAAGLWRRKLWAVALLSLLPTRNKAVLNHMDQIVNICVDVLTEEQEGRGKHIGQTLRRIVQGEDDSHGEEGGAQDACAPPTPLLETRLKQELQGDVSVTTDIKALVRQSIERLRVTIGETAWQEIVETVEPVVLGQLQRMVA